MARRVIGVVAVAKGRTGSAGCELAEIGLGENDRALGSIFSTIVALRDGTKVLNKAEP